MIKSFADTETEKVFRREFSKKLPGDNDNYRPSAKVTVNPREGVNF